MDRKEKRKKQAEERQTYYDNLTLEQKIESAVASRGNATKQLKKLRLKKKKQDL